MYDPKKKSASKSPKLIHTKSTKDADLLESQIEKLNEDIFILILNYLSIVEKIKIERVSTEWREMAKKSWTKLKILKVEPQFLGLKPCGTKHQYPEINEYILEEILKRCGKYLTSIDYSSLDNNCHLALVAKYCPSIQSITGSNASKDGLEKLSQNIQSLSEFTINNDLDKDCEDTIARLFSRNKNLRILNLRSEDMKGYCLFELPLEEMTAINITLSRNNCILQENFISALIKTKKLNVFRENDMNAELIKTLASCCTNLTKLDLKSRSKIDNVDEKLSEVFINNSKIKALTLDIINMNGNCLLFLNENFIEEIHLTASQNFQGITLVQSLPNFTKLNSLIFRGFQNKIHNSIANAVQLSSKLKKLHFFGGNYLEKEILINSVTSLKNLQELVIVNLFPGSIPRNYFNHVSSNLLELKNLCLGRCEDASDIDLEAICKLPKLEILEIFDIQNITGSGLANLSNLKEFRCYDCENLEDDSLISLLKCASNLELLDVIRCRKITNSTINFAIKVTKSRRNNVVLKIKIIGCSVNIDEIAETSPFLIIDEKFKL